MKMSDFQIRGEFMAALLGMAICFAWFDAIYGLVLAAVMGLLYVALRLFDSKGQMLSQAWYLRITTVLLMALLLTRLYPFWLSSAPLGFDTGIYRYELFQLLQSLPEFTSSLFPGLPILAAVLGSFGMTVDQMMVGLPLFFVLLFGVLNGVYARDRWGRELLCSHFFY